MHWLEFDWRYSWALETLKALDHGVEKISNEYSDGLDLLEHAEEIVGLGFVALQTYVSGTITTLKKVFRPLSAADEDLRSRNCRSASGVTVVESIWAAGNYYKHHDMWPDWNPKGRRGSIILTLSKLGISAASKFPCVETMEVLQGPGAPLVGLLEVASTWREASFSQLRR